MPRSANEIANKVSIWLTFTSSFLLKLTHALIWRSEFAQFTNPSNIQSTIYESPSISWSQQTQL
jgi:hypothetical protein